MRSNTNKAMWCTAAIAAVLLSACGREPKSVEYYVANKSERDAVLTECNKNPGKFKNDGDCINAHAAVMKGWSGDVKMPTLDLSPKKPVETPKK